MRRAKEIFGNVDWMSVSLYILLIFFGWVNIYASQYNDDQTLLFDLSQRYSKQLLFIAVSLFVAFIILIIDWKFFEAFPYFLYGGIIILLIVVIIILSFYLAYNLRTFLKHWKTSTIPPSIKDKIVVYLPHLDKKKDKY